MKMLQGIFFIYLILLVNSCQMHRHINKENEIDEVLFVPAPSREFKYSPLRKEFTVTYPYSTDRFYLGIKPTNTSATYQLLNKDLQNVDLPLSLNFGVNTFYVKTKTTENQVSSQKFNVVRNPWELINEHAQYEGRDGSGIVVFKNSLWLLGGWMGKKDKPLVSEVWTSDDGLKWRLVGDAPWPARHSFNPVVFNDKIWVISGEGHADVWCSGDGETWELVNDNAPWGKRYCPFVFSFQGKLWLMGGISWWDDAGRYVYPDGVPPIAFNDVWVSANGIEWKKVVDHASWSPRGIVHGSIVFRNKMWIIGGGVKGSEIIEANNDVWSSSDGITWEQVTKEAQWKPRLHFSTAVHNNKIWITDGSVIPKQSNLSNEVWFSSDGKTWEQLPGTPWIERHASSLCSFQDRLLITAGAIPGMVTNDIWQIKEKF